MTKFLLGLLTLMTTLVIGGIMLFQQSVTPLYQVEAETNEYVKEHADIIQVNDFYWYNGTEESYYTVDGFNSDAERQIVLVRQSDGHVETYNYDNTVSEYDAYHQVMTEASPSKILNMRIGMTDDGTPMWEASFKDKHGKMGYYYIHLETSEVLETITNL